ncbi:hypothetical protein [Scytonema sp. NUACC26]
MHSSLFGKGIDLWKVYNSSELEADPCFVCLTKGVVNFAQPTQLKE